MLPQENDHNVMVLIQIWELSKLWHIDSLMKHTEYLLTFSLDHRIRFVVAPHCEELKRWYNNSFIEKCPNILFDDTILALCRRDRIELLSIVFENSATDTQDVFDLIELQDRYVKANKIHQWFEQNQSKIDTGNDEDENTLEEAYRQQKDLEDISSFFQFKRLNYAELLPAVHRVNNIVKFVRSKIDSILGPDEDDEDLLLLEE